MNYDFTAKDVIPFFISSSDTIDTIILTYGGWKWEPYTKSILLLLLHIC